MKLLSIGADAKTKKGQKFGYLTGILYLAPARESGVINTCPHASAGCKIACLFTAGMGVFSNVRQSRIDRTLLFKSDRVAFLAKLTLEISALVKKANKAGLTPVVRLNGTSDLPWENLGIFGKFPNVQFYDYTKNPARAIAFARGEMPANYHLTFSRAESNAEAVQSVIAAGGNVAAVFSGVLPARYLGRKVVNGDLSDLRFLDGKKVVVGLKAKGKARKDFSGFVVHTREGK